MTVPWLLARFCLPGNVFDKPTLFKQAQHALLRAGPYPAGMLLPLDMAGSFVCVLTSPFLAWPFTARKGVLTS